MSDERELARGNADLAGAVFPEAMPRRQALRFLGGVVGAATGLAAPGLGALGALVTGCGGGATEEEPVRQVEVALDSLPEGERVVVTFGDTVVELLRHGDEVSARSLRCTHFGCTVNWSPEREEYVCPCHDGVYGPDGRVRSGPPSRPLPTLPVERRDGLVVVRAEGAEVVT